MLQIMSLLLEESYETERLTEVRQGIGILVDRLRQAIRQLVDTNIHLIKVTVVGTDIQLTRLQLLTFLHQVVHLLTLGVILIALGLHLILEAGLCCLKLLEPAVDIRKTRGQTLSGCHFHRMIGIETDTAARDDISRGESPALTHGITLKGDVLSLCHDFREVADDMLITVDARILGNLLDGRCLDLYLTVVANALHCHVVTTDNDRGL